MDFVPRNTTSVIIPFFAQDITSPTGAGLTGILSTSPNISCYYMRDNDTAPTNIPLRAGTVGTYISSGIVPVSTTIAGGDYQLCPPDVCWSGAINFTTISLVGVANMLPVKLKFLLTATPIGSIAPSGIPANAFVPLSEPIAVPVWPMNPMDGINWMGARSINKNLTLTNVSSSGGYDVVYKQDGTTPIGSGQYSDDGINFTRNKYS